MPIQTMCLLTYFLLILCPWQQISSPKNTRKSFVQKKLFHDAENGEVTNFCFISKDPHRFYGSTPSCSLAYYIYIQILQGEP